MRVAPAAPTPKIGAIFTRQTTHGTEHASIAWYIQRKNGEWQAGLNSSCGVEHISTANFPPGLTHGHWIPEGWVWDTTQHLFRPPNTRLEGRTWVPDSTADAAPSAFPDVSELPAIRGREACRTWVERCIKTFIQCDSTEGRQFLSGAYDQKKSAA